MAVSKSDTQGGLGARVNVQEAKEFKVTVELKEMPDEIRNGLRPGMSATATITTKVKNNVVAVPLEAIVEKVAKRVSFARQPLWQVQLRRRKMVRSQRTLRVFTLSKARR